MSYLRVIVQAQSGERTLHVLVADDGPDAQYVITAYEPSTGRWEADFRTRKERS